jgi:hypothetical protein
MGFCLDTAVEDISALTQENAQLQEAVNDLSYLLSEDDDEDEDDDDDDEKAKKKKDDDDEDDDAGSWLAKMKAAKGQKESRSYKGSTLTESSSLDSLLGEIRSIGLNESEEAQVVNKQSKLIEGYESVLESCNEICDRIAGVIAEDLGVVEGEDFDLDPEDVRVQIGEFFAGIAESAENYLAVLAEGEVPFKVAEEDLRRLHFDVQKGLDAMQEVE